MALGLTGDFFQTSRCHRTLFMVTIPGSKPSVYCILVGPCACRRVSILIDMPAVRYAVSKQAARRSKKIFESGGRSPQIFSADSSVGIRALPGRRCFPSDLCPADWTALLFCIARSLRIFICKGVAKEAAPPGRGGAYSGVLMIGLLEGLDFDPGRPRCSRRITSRRGDRVERSGRPDPRHELVET